MRKPPPETRRGRLVGCSAQAIDDFIDAEHSEVLGLGGGSARAAPAESTLDGPLAQAHEAADDDGPVAGLDVAGAHLDVVHGVAAVEVHIAVEAGEDGGDGGVHGWLPFGSAVQLDAYRGPRVSNSLESRDC